MKKTRFLFATIFWALLVHGASFGSQSGKAPQQTPSPSGGKSANNGSPDGSKDTQTRGENENEKGFPGSRQSTPKHRPFASHANQGPSRQLHSSKMPTANNLRTKTPRNAPDSHQTSSTAPSEVPNKPPRHAGIPVPPPTAALNAQQFKNSRDPGARMATSGGSANSPRGTAVINGSAMKRKP
jgi:hypothetical protein